MIFIYFQRTVEVIIVSLYYRFVDLESFWRKPSVNLESYLINFKLFIVRFLDKYTGNACSFIRLFTAYTETFSVLTRYF